MGAIIEAVIFWFLNHVHILFYNCFTSIIAALITVVTALHLFITALYNCYNCFISVLLLLYQCFPTPVKLSFSFRLLLGKARLMFLFSIKE